MDQEGSSSDARMGFPHHTTCYHRPLNGMYHLSYFSLVTHRRRSDAADKERARVNSINLEPRNSCSL